MAEQLDTARKEAAAVREQLQHTRKALVEERVARVELAAEATRRINALQQELVTASAASQEEVRRSSRDRLLVTVGSVLLAGLVLTVLIAGGIQWASLPGTRGESPHTEESSTPPPTQDTASVPDHPPPTSAPAGQNAPALAPPAPAPAGSAQARALMRLSDALEPVPGPSMPAVLGAANRWLGMTGQPPCSVESPRGDVSLAIEPGKDSPLLSALNRCAGAVEHLTGNASHGP
jgi:hypothetical protein